MAHTGSILGLARKTNLLRMGCIVIAFGMSQAALAREDAQSGDALVIDNFVPASAQPTESKAKPGPPLPLADITVGSAKSIGAAPSTSVAAIMTAQFGATNSSGATRRMPDRAVARTNLNFALSDIGRVTAPLAAGCGTYSYRPSNSLKPQNEAYRQMLLPYVVREACSAGIPAGLLDALIIQESRYNALAVSNKGAIGLTQLMPGTAMKIGADAYSVEGNIRGGAAYLRSMMETFGGQTHLALAAYNAGPGAVLRYGGIPAFRETQGYVASILGLWGYLSQ